MSWRNGRAVEKWEKEQGCRAEQVLTLLSPFCRFVLLPQVVVPEYLQEMFAIHWRSGRDGTPLLPDAEIVVVGGDDELKEILVAPPQSRESVCVSLRGSDPIGGVRVVG